MKKAQDISDFLSGMFQNTNFRPVLTKKLRSCYLVDYENVHQDGLTGIKDLHRHSVVCVFYSNNAQTISVDFARILNNSNARILFFKIVTGQKNSLDFQLVSFLGFLIAAHQALDVQIPYYIISKDTGFSSTVALWRDLGIKLFQTDRISKCDNVHVVSEKDNLEENKISETGLLIPEKNSLEQDAKLLDYLSRFDSNQQKFIYNAVTSSKDVVAFRSKIAKKYGEPFAIKHYKNMKKLLPYAKNKK